MQTVPVPIFGPVYRNVDGVECNDVCELLVDGYLSELGATVRRPGLDTWLDLGVASPAAVDGLYWWPQKACAIAVCGGRPFKLTFPSRVPTATALSASSPLNERIRPTFCTDGTYVFMANGGRIYYSDGTALAAAIADADAPTEVSHVAFMDGYLIANWLDSNKWSFADLDTPLSWDAANYFNAAGDADYVKALFCHNREIVLVGQATTERWENTGDATVRFARVANGFMEAGCLAPSSLIKTEDAFYWLDQSRRIVKWSGGKLEGISTPYDKEIAGYSSPQDCLGDYIKIDGKPFLLFQFLGDQKCLVCNLANDPPDWCQWQNWNSTAGEYRRLKLGCYCWCPDWGVHLVGSPDSSVIYAMSPDYYDDDGEEIRLLRRSGHIDYGTTKRKVSRELRLRLKRGKGLSDRTPELMVRWKDNNQGWKQERRVSLGDVGDTNIIRRVKTGGIYRTRQYEFSCTDAVPLTFLGAEEDIEVLAS